MEKRDEHYKTRIDAQKKKLDEAVLEIKDLNLQIKELEIKDLHRKIKEPNVQNTTEGIAYFSQEREQLQNKINAQTTENRHLENEVAQLTTGLETAVAKVHD